jgi:glycine oxidase
MGSIGIVGGGIIGMSAAWRLAQAGFRVSVYERSKIGGEASWAGAGMLAPGGEFEEATELARMAVESRDLYGGFVEELQRDSGLAIDFQETGALDAAYSSEELEQLQVRAARQVEMGIPSKAVTPEQMAIFWPRLNREGLAGGYFYPGDAAVDPRDVMAALRVACEHVGVRLAEGEEVGSIAVAPDGVQVGAQRHDAVVIAAGAWSGLIAISGVPALPASEAVRGHLIGYHQPDQTCNTIVRRNHTYLLQRANGLLIAGASVERVGFERAIDARATRTLEKEAAQLLPHLSETTPSAVWNGFRPGSDELRLGGWHSERVYLAYGHYRNGILLAPATAKHLTGEISANLRRR